MASTYTHYRFMRNGRTAHAPIYGVADSWHRAGLLPSPYRGKVRSERALEGLWLEAESGRVAVIVGPKAIEVAS